MVHPIKTGTGAVKFLLVRSVLPTPPPLAEAATLNAPIKLDVQRISKRKDTADASFGWGGRTYYREDVSLHITLQNLSPHLLTNVVVRWAISKIPVGRNPSARDVCYGAQETVVLKPVKEKIIETPPIELAGQKYTVVGRASGDMIRGHGVQVMIGTNLIAEELSPSSIKISFKNLQPVPKPAQ